jgi:hypothetical protein
VNTPKKRGRHKGSRDRVPRPPHEGSLNDKLFRLAVGEYVYVEAVSAAHLQSLQTRASAAAFRPGQMKGRVFSSAAFTAVGADLGAVRWLVRFQREEDDFQLEIQDADQT